MTAEIKTEILIQATASKIWTILTDFENYPNWNPFIQSITGEVKKGKKIKVRIRQSESNEMAFNPKILNYEVNKQIVWLGHLLFSGVFDGEHKFELIDNGNGTTTFKQSEKFKGILVPFLKKQLEHNTKNGFEEMNKKLKDLAEQN